MGDEELWELVERGLRMTDERILQSPEGQVYRSIRAQLALVAGHLIDRRRSPRRSGSG